MGQAKNDLRWQPIDTAPKNGTVIDLWVDGERLPNCYWGEAWQDPEDRRWLQQYAETRASAFPVDGEPTHWAKDVGPDQETAENANTYLIRVSPEHARALLTACELYMRIAMGQTKEIGAAFEGKNGEWQKQRDQGLDAACEHLKRILFPDLAPNAYYGIMSEQAGKAAHLCLEVFTTLRHRVNWTECPLKEGDFPGVSHDEPLLFPSGVTPRPQCAAESGEQPELAKSPYKLARSIEDIIGTNNLQEAENILRRWREELGTTGFIKSKKATENKKK